MPKLTALQVKNAKPGRHADGDGLYLLVRDKGARSWVLRVMVDGVRKDYGLGSANTLSLSDARAKADAWRKLAKAGIDPAEQAKAARRVIPTFKKAATEYHDHVKPGWKNRKHGKQWLSTLETYAFPSLGSKRVDRIGTADIHAALLPIWLTVPETARRVRQRIAVVLDYCHGQGWREAEAPMRAVNQLLRNVKQPKAGKFAAMHYRDVPALVRKLRSEDATAGRMCLLFTILTAARSGEGRGAMWEEIDWSAAEWAIPPERMKAGELHIVPLSPAVMSMLAELREGDNPTGLIFPGRKRGKPLSDMTLAKVLRVAGGGGATVHGFRSSFRDWVAEKCPTVPGDVAEAALAHRVKDKTEASYRRATYLDQRKDLMASWADYLGGASSNVVRLATG